jgi:catechol 2,3-dioxygenase-like lactoylglutathione lyase family enzyme
MVSVYERGGDMQAPSTEDPYQTRDTGAAFGQNMKLNARVADRAQIQRLFEEVLGCEVTRRGRADFVRFRNDFYLGIIYNEQTLGEADGSKGIWLELRVADPEATKQKVLALGLREVHHWDNDHFYFQVPGGQVFRLAPLDMVNGWGLRGLGAQGEENR